MTHLRWLGLMIVVQGAVILAITWPRWPGNEVPYSLAAFAFGIQFVFAMRCIFGSSLFKARSRLPPKPPTPDAGVRYDDRWTQNRLETLAARAVNAEEFKSQVMAAITIAGGYKPGAGGSSSIEAALMLPGTDVRHWLVRELRELHDRRAGVWEG